MPDERIARLLLRAAAPTEPLFRSLGTEELALFFLQLGVPVPR